MIKEFDLDAPESSKEDRIRFRNETRCISALLERCYRPSKETGKSWKILVEVVPSGARKGHINLLGVLVTQVVGDVDYFLRVQAGEKKKLALDLLMSGVKNIANDLSLDIHPFECAADMVVGRGYVNEWVWGKKVSNMSGSMSAEVLVRHEINAATISALIKDKDRKTIGEFALTSDKPNEFIFMSHLGRFSWVDDSTVQLLSRDGSIRYTARVC